MLLLNRGLTVRRLLCFFFFNRKIHSGMKTYGCELCGKSFLDSLRLRMHLLSHSGKDSNSMKPTSQHFLFSSWLRVEFRERPAF